MRQRRQRLQVSTFPFLAVLLCAMGSLILLLLVIDRRAKVVARAKALQALAQLSVDEVKADEARRADWERRRAEWEARRHQLHEQLVEQDQEVLSQVQAVREKATAAAAGITAEDTHLRQLQERLQAEHAQIARWEEEVSAKRAEVSQAEQQVETSQAEMARLTAELERMERTLNDLKAARQRQQQMYSLVPYRGKRGDNRKPLYLECTANALIFHPDRIALGTGPTLLASTIRAEIERRIAGRGQATPVANGKPEENAYLLMLVRPDGITTYYRTVAALQGLKIDFGYEFIDKDWILDFSEDNAGTARQSWLAAQTVPAAPPGRTTPRKVTGLNPGAVARATSRYQGVAFNPNGASEGPGSVPGPRGGSGPGGPLRAEGVLGGSNVPGGFTGQFPQVGQAGNGTGSRGGVGDGTGAGGPYPSGARPNAASGQNLLTGPLPGGGSAGTGPGSGGDGASPGAGGALVPDPSSSFPAVGRISNPSDPQGRIGNSSYGGRSSDSTPGQSVAGVGQSIGPLRGNAGGVELGQPMPLGEGERASSTAQVGGAASGGRPFGGTGTGTQVASSGGNGNPAVASGVASAERPSQEEVKPSARDLPPGLLPATMSGPSRAAAEPGTGGAQASGAEGSGGGAAGAPQGAAGGGGEAGTGQDGGEGPAVGPRDPLASLAGQNGPRRPSRAFSVWPGLFTSNRDWIITIECTADALVISSTGQRITTTDLARAEDGGKVLRETLEQMIARRQASVRPGEPPYRPMIRFRVPPMGMRAYYLAYPALEGLGVKMTRVNVDPAEEAKNAAWRKGEP
jgi:hypothetical protein